MGLESELRTAIDSALDPVVEQIKTGRPQDLDAMQAIERLVLPVIASERDAILRVAREVDNLRNTRGTD